MSLNWIPQTAWFGTEASLREVVEATCIVRESVDIRVLNPQAFFTPDEADEEEELEGERDETGLLLRFEDIGILDIQGGLTSNDSWLNALFGFTSYSELQQALTAAAEDDGIKALLLNIDSPGGDAKGLGETARLIQTIDHQVKPVVSYAGGSMDSAAYWLGMQARHIYVNDMADVGSIGVIAVHKEMSEMLKQDGVKVTVLRAGKYKSLGSPYERLSDEARAEIQGRIDQLHGFFLDAVAQARRIDRSEVEARVGQGRTYLGADAVAVGLADEVMYFNDAVARVREMASHRTRSGSVQLPTSSSVGAMNDMSRKLRISEKVQAALAAGVPVTELPPDVLASSDPDAPEKEGEAPQSPQKEEVPDNEPTRQPTETDANEGQGNPPPPPPDPQKPQNPGAAITARAPDLAVYLQQQLAARDEQVMTLRLQVERLQVELNEVKANRPSLLRIAQESVQRMQIALGGTPMPLEHLTDGALVAEHARVSQVFGERFRVGGVAQIAQESDVNDDTAVGQVFKQRLQAVRFGRAAAAGDK